jgi:hypothetical protein
MDMQVKDRLTAIGIGINYDAVTILSDPTFSGDFRRR